jgi:hypothetical protein
MSYVSAMSSRRLGFLSSGSRGTERPPLLSPFEQPTGWFTGRVTSGGRSVASSEARLGHARARRWWVTRRRIGSIERAAAFVDDVGFALLFPKQRVLAPSLWEAVAGEDAEPFAAGMGTSEQKVWEWKDELPRRGLAWYGVLLAGRGSFLAPALVAALYPGDGAIDDHEALPLSAAAHEIASALAAEPLPSAALRALIGDRRRYESGIVELQRQLLVTRAGVRDNRSGWPSALLDLTCRQFVVGGRRDLGMVAARFLDTALEATAADLARTFRWHLAQAREHLDELVRTGRAAADGDRYLTRSMGVPT